MARKHVRVWETKHATNPEQNGIVVQGCFDYPTQLYSHLKDCAMKFDFGTAFRVEQEDSDGNWVFLEVLDIQQGVDYLLVTLLEECAEVQQAATKAYRFGLNNHHPNRSASNADDILMEYYQLTALIEQLQKDNLLPTLNDKDVESIKKAKLIAVKMYMEDKRVFRL